MTPTEVETYARNLYNAVNDTFFIQDEVFKLIYQAEMVLSKDALVIEAYDASTSTVASTQSYAVPTRFIAVKRVTWNGQKLQKINQREDDSLTLSNSATTDSGNPQYYYEWNDTIYLRPIPASIQTLAFWGYKEPAQLNSGATVLSVPTRYHMDLVDHVVSEMYAKDSNPQMALYYQNRWDKKVLEAKRWEAKKKRRDSFASVLDEENLSQTLLGHV